jgi:hypothetical protein
MTARFCMGCGKKIPRHFKTSDGRTKKTKKNRQFCFNCSPLRPPKNNHTKEHKSERRKRKEYLVKMLGGHCSKCGYHASMSALSFHHKNSKDKCFNLSNNGNLMQDWDIVLAEAKKCILLCLNCHAEIHNGF